MIRKISFLFSLCFISAGVYSQDFTHENCFMINNEKTFVHLENNIFVAGQYMPYKVYVVNSSTLKPTLRSKIIYFEIFGAGGKIMHWHQELFNGTCSGRIVLPDTLTGGIYSLKAYTNWMRNFSSDLFFTQYIFITRLGSDLKEIITDHLPSPDSINIVPVNGGIVAGTENIFSYDINENILLSDSAVVQVKDTSGVVIKSFLFMNHYLGEFSFIPDAGNSYYLEIIDRTKNLQTKICDTESPGFSIAIEERNDLISFQLLSDYDAKGLKIPFDLSVYCGSKLVSEESFLFEKGKYSLQILKNRFSKPLIDAVLKNSMGEILCRRIFALTPKKSVQPEITSIKEVYG